jgi:tellurite methyltransferase
MERAMTGFVTDVDGHWVATLGCGHRQHVRHDPPLVERPWVTTEAGRHTRLGQYLDCVRCDAFEIPDGFVSYERTDTFTAETVPAGLRTDHTVKAGVWAKIMVLEGRLRYHVATRAQPIDLTADHPGIVAPEVSHHVEPLGAVRFFVEFWHAPA